MKTLALLAVVMLAGCDDDDDEPTADAGTAPAWAGTANPDALARASLHGSSLAKQQLVASAAGRDLLTRVVSCALPAGSSITGLAADGTPYQFAGSLGLAPTWADHPASAAERRRVIACVHGARPTTAPVSPAPMVGSIAPAARRG
jgi:hypothetical protein